MITTVCQAAVIKLSQSPPFMTCVNLDPDHLYLKNILFNKYFNVSKKSDWAIMKYNLTFQVISAKCGMW